MNLLFPCQDNAEDQNFEFGRRDTAGVLGPVNVDHWSLRQETMRAEIMRLEKQLVTRTLAEIDLETALHEFDTVDNTKRRRAAVFYVDKGKNKN